MSTEMISSLDDFLSHRTGGGGSSYMKSWKKRVPPQIDIWLHTKRLPVSIPQHNFPIIREMEDRDTGAKKFNVWSNSYNCHEAEATVKDQYKYNDDGTRRAPATKCPLCRLIDAVRRQTDEGILGFTQPIFKFEGSDDLKVIHAGGLYNAYGGQLTDEEKKWLKIANIRRDEAWMENGNAKINYMFSVVDNDDPGSGVQVTTETSLLGDKTKDVIIGQRKARGDKGDPFKSPYCIRWEHHKMEQQFQKKYSATAMTEMPYTKVIRDLIEGDPPDVAQMLRPFKIDELRTLLEKSVEKGVKLPWDEIFDVTQEEDNEPERPAEEREAGSVKPDEDEDTCPECGPGKACPHVACDQCEKPILKSDPVCKHCGHNYAQVTQTVTTKASGRKRA